MINEGKEIVEKLLEASIKIHKASLKGSGNFIYLSPQDWLATNTRILKCKKILDKINEYFN
jgi:hypothetical protein